MALHPSFHPSLRFLLRAFTLFGLVVGLLLTAGCAAPPLVSYGPIEADPADPPVPPVAIRVAPLEDGRIPSHRGALGAKLDRSGQETRRYGSVEVRELGSRLGAGTTDVLQATGVSAWLSEDGADTSGPVLRGRVEEFWLTVKPTGILGKQPRQIVRLSYELVNGSGRVVWIGSVEGEAYQEIPIVTAGTRSRIATYATNQALERALKVFRSKAFRDALATLQSSTSS